MNTTYEVTYNENSSKKEQCWICFEYINDSILLPYHDDYFGHDGSELSVFKNTVIIKDVGPFKFLYYVSCNKCIDDYLKYYGRIFKTLKKRELTGSFHILN